MVSQAPTRKELELVDATPENIKPAGELLGPDSFEPGLGIPFDTGAVLEGKPINFQHTGRAVVRCAKVFRRVPEVKWVERHMHLSQLFIGLGDKPYLMVLAPPNHTEGKGRAGRRQGQDVPNPARAGAATAPWYLERLPDCRGG